MDGDFNWKNKKQLAFLIFIMLLAVVICLVFVEEKHRGFVFSGMLIVIPIPIGIIIADAIGKKLFQKDIARYGLNKDDFAKKKDYYRDILEIDSPLIIGFIDDMDLEISEKELVAELLYLKGKNVIDFQDGKIVKLNYTNTVDLLMSDKLFLSKIIDGKLKIQEDAFFLLKLKGEILQESMNRFKLVYTKKEDYTKYIAYFCIMMLLSALIMKVDTKITDVISMLFMLIPMGYMSIVSFEMQEKEKNKKKNSNAIEVNVRKRTKEGEKLNKNIEGLKLFLKDYSMLEEKSSELVSVWEDYMVYSVLFGQNQKIIEEYKKYIE